MKNIHVALAVILACAMVFCLGQTAFASIESPDSGAVAAGGGAAIVAPGVPAAADPVPGPGTNINEPIPEPTTLLIWSLFGGAAGMGIASRKRRRRSRWSDENRQAIRQIIDRG